MRRGSCLLTLALMGVLALDGSPVSAQPNSQYRSGAQVDVGIFYDGLSQYGDWVEMPQHGWSWSPRVERGWRPYTRGQWVMTEDGWYWDSDEQFGWAAYHYGRWVNDRDYGWIWVPGTEWAPAWVSWRHGDGYTGWAPLPPRASWGHVGLSIGGLEIDAFIGSNDYAFVQDRWFVERGVYQRVLPPAQNVTIINVTNNVTNYTVVNQRVRNGGIAVATVERAAGRKVPRLRMVDAQRADAPRHPKANELAVYRPQVRNAPERKPAQGRSLVRGDEPPPQLAERRRERQQEREQKSEEPVTAKQAQQQPRAPRDHAPQAVERPPSNDAKAQQQQAQKERAQAQQAADRKNAIERNEQRLEKEKNQAGAQQQRTQANQDAAQKRAKDQEQQRANVQQQRAAEQEKQRADREKNQAGAQQQREQQQARADQRAKAAEQQQANQKAQAEKRAQAAEQQQANQKAQADKRAQAAEQQQAKKEKGKQGKGKDKEEPPPPPEKPQP